MVILYHCAYVSQRRQIPIHKPHMSYRVQALRRSVTTYKNNPVIRVTGKLQKLTNFVEVKWKLSRNRTVQTSFQIRSPILIQDIFTACILLANTSDSRIHAFATIDIFDGGLSKEEENVLANIVRSHEIRFCQNKRKINKYR